MKVLIALVLCLTSVTGHAQWKEKAERPKVTVFIGTEEQRSPFSLDLKPEKKPRLFLGVEQRFGDGSAQRIGIQPKLRQLVTIQMEFY
jgi:hypothetical protein